MTEQLLISYRGEDPGVEFVTADPCFNNARCMCQSCVEDRIDWQDQRHEQRRERCPGEAEEIADRVQLYERRYADSLGLFEDIEIYEQV